MCVWITQRFCAGSDPLGLGMARDSTFPSNSYVMLMPLVLEDRLFGKNPRSQNGTSPQFNSLAGNRFSLIQASSNFFLSSLPLPHPSLFPIPPSPSLFSFSLSPSSPLSSSSSPPFSASCILSTIFSKDTFPDICCYCFSSWNLAWWRKYLFMK